jgi:hypothetical protein
MRGLSAQNTGDCFFGTTSQSELLKLPPRELWDSGITFELHITPLKFI